MGDPVKMGGRFEECSVVRVGDDDDDQYHDHDEHTRGTNISACKASWLSSKLA